MTSDTPAESLGEFDYIVIGAGTAGCLLANRLSADPRRRVALIEAGGKDDYIWIHIPVGYLYCFDNPRVDWGFKTAAEPGLNGRSLAYPRGKVLGGCSSINGMIYMRGQARDYDGWRQMGNAGWGWDDVLPFFLRHQDQFALDQSDFGATHARGGEWRVEKPRVRWDILDAWMEAAAQAGIPKVRDFNGGDNEGSSYFHVNQRSGWRWNTAKAFLRPALKRGNLRVLTRTLVERLVIEGRKVTGVRVRHEGHPAVLQARRAVVMSAGAIGSPQILELSGIGRPDVLGQLGIAVEHALPGVGENLQDHLQVRCAYKVHGITTLNETSQGLFDKARIGIQYVLSRSGPMSMAPSQVGTFAKSDPRLETANLQYHVQPLTLPKFGEPLDPFPAFTASVCNLRPTSRGSVHSRSLEPGAEPEIRPNYLSTEDDRRVAAEAIRLTRRIVSQPALNQYRPEEFKPGPQIISDADLARAAGDIATTIFHPVGTCRMGADANAVVSSTLEVRGLDGLRIADASIMPTIVSGNTNSPTLMIAEKAADMILRAEAA